MEIDPYLTLEGNCEAAFKFYERCLGGEIIMMMTHAGSPMAARTPHDWLDKVMHARLKVGDKLLMGSDSPPGQYTPPSGFNIIITLNNIAEAERIFAALAEGGGIRMPLQQTFWAARFGMLTDRFGIPWMINGGDGT